MPRMTPDIPETSQTTAETRRATPALSLFVLLALLSTAPGAIALETVPVHGRVAAGTYVMPVLVVACEEEEPELWHAPRSRDAQAHRGSQVDTLPRPLREALLALPPPACA